MSIEADDFLSQPTRPVSSDPLPKWIAGTRNVTGPRRQQSVNGLTGELVGLLRLSPETVRGFSDMKETGRQMLISSGNSPRQRIKNIFLGACAATVALTVGVAAMRTLRPDNPMPSDLEVGNQSVSTATSAHLGASQTVHQGYRGNFRNPSVSHP